MQSIQVSSHEWDLHANGSLDFIVTVPQYCMSAHLEAVIPWDILCLNEDLFELRKILGMQSLSSLQHPST